MQVLLCHPASVAGLPTDCQQVEGSDLPTGPGRCRYKPYIGIAYRANTFDNYMNSQECLVGPGTEFLSGYGRVQTEQYLSLCLSKSLTLCKPGTPRCCGPTWTPCPPRVCSASGRTASSWTATNTTLTGASSPSEPRCGTWRAVQAFNIAAGIVQNHSL